MSYFNMVKNARLRHIIKSSVIIDHNIYHNGCLVLLYSSGPIQQPHNK